MGEHCEVVAARLSVRLAELAEDAKRLRHAHSILDPRPPAPRVNPGSAPREVRAVVDQPPITWASLAQLDDSNRTGSRFSSRRRESVRQVARCQNCKRERDGVTRFESMSFGKRPAGRPIHFCDACAAAIVERPLDDVLIDYLNAAHPASALLPPFDSPQFSDRDKSHDERGRR